MKIKAFETLQCDAGWRIFSFLKIETDAGITGWSEFNESFGSPGLGSAIETLMQPLIGMDPHRIELINAVLNSRTVQSRGGIARQAIGAIENALLDIKGKDLGVPVYQLFGGAVRDRLQVYWSHCGSYRLRNPDILGVKPVRTYDDIAEVGAEVRAKGFTALKTNTALAVGDQVEQYRPGFMVGRGFPERNWDRHIAESAARTVQAFRDGAGPDMGIMLDLNFHFRTEGFRWVGEALGDLGLTWLEIDLHDARSLAMLRQNLRCPLASGETLLERRDFKPYFEQNAMDVAIVDVVWNGFNESLKIAAMADAYDVNVAPHNFYGHLASVMSAHFSAAVPNFRIMETDIDAVPWRDELVMNPPVIENGEFVLPTGPGWGIEVNEAGIRAHPPRELRTTV